MDPNNLDRTLLFGTLAVQAELINVPQLVNGLNQCASEGNKTLGQVLVEQGSLSPKVMNALEAMVKAHIDQHGGDPARSLAGLSSADAVRSAIESQVSPSFHDALTLLGDQTLSYQPDAEMTVDDSTSRGIPSRVDNEPGSRFRVLRMHARGGLGQVFVARDNELGRDVALKEIHSDKASIASLRQRFVLEAEINGNLEHPGIVPVYGLGTYDDGRPFYAMRFIQGDSLKEALEAFHKARNSAEAPLRRPYASLAFRQLMRRFVDVCNAVGYAHSRGVLHRDLKPSNVMLGKYGETLIIDWGLAKATGHAEPGSEDIDNAPLLPTSGSSIEQTEAGTALGTPAFMSPEQAAGRLDSMGPSSDCYSLGATLYAILTGRAPVVGDTVPEVIGKVIAGQIDPPRSVVPEVPRSLAAIAMKAMALKPEDRYPTTRALADDVERWLADEPVSADREPWIEKATRWAKRHRTLVVSAATASILALLSLGTIAAIQTQSRNDLLIKNVELTSANRARGQALDKANARVDLALEALGQFRQAVTTNLDVQNRPENSPLRSELLKAPVAFFGKLRDDLRDDPGARVEDRLKLAASLLELAQLTTEIGNQESALKSVEEAIAVLEGLPALPDSTAEGSSALLKRLDAMRLKGYLLQQSGKLDEALDTLNKGVALAEPVANRSTEMNPRFPMARLLSSIGQIAQKTKDVDNARKVYERALTVVDGITPKEDEQATVLRMRSSLLGDIAYLQSQGGNPKLAAETFKSAVRMLEPLINRPEPEWVTRGMLAYLHVSIASNESQLGNEAKAIEELEAGSKIRRAMIQERPADLDNQFKAVDCLNELSQAQLHLGRAETSLLTLQETRKLLDSLRFENPRNTRVLALLKSVNNSRGSSLYQLGRIEESIASFAENVPILEELVRLEPANARYRADQAGNLYNMAVLSKNIGKVDASIEADNKALAVRRTLVRDFPKQPAFQLQVAASLGNLGATYVANKEELQTGLDYFLDAVAILEDLTRKYPDVSVYSEYLVRSRLNAASVLSRLGRDQEAFETGQALLPLLEKRIKAQPKLFQARLDFASHVGNHAKLAGRLGRYDEAIRLMNLAEEGLRAVPEGNLQTPEVVIARLNGHFTLAEIALWQNRLDDALRYYDFLVNLARPKPPEMPRDGRIVEDLKTALFARAEVLGRLGRTDAAKADLATLTEAAALDSAYLKPYLASLILAWTGDPDQFIASAQQVLASQPPKDAEYRLMAQSACDSIQRLQSAPGSATPESKAKVERLTQSALTWLRAAHTNGSLQGLSGWKSLVNHDFQTIANLPEFRTIYYDVIFPKDPFLPKTPAR